jgi:hypothetical protein
LAVIRKLLLRPGALENLDGFVEPRAALLEWQAGRAAKPCVAASQAAFQAPIGENVHFGNGASKAHGVLERQGKERNPEADAFGALRGCGK